MALVIKKEDFQKEVLESDVPVLVDFYATWCGPCKTLSPVIDQISKESNDIKICKVDVDEESELASEFGVMSIPTLIAFKDGEEIKRVTGVRPKHEILSMLK